MKYDGNRLARALLYASMAIALWVTLGLAYFWSVRKLARMSRPDALGRPSEGPRIDIVEAKEKLSS